LPAHRLGGHGALGGSRVDTRHGGRRDRDPAGSRNKYEYDEERGVIRFDRRLTGAIAFPADYGFVPGTVGADGEPLDALVLLAEPGYPGVRVATRPVGVFWIRAGSRREAKLLCVPEGEPAYEQVRTIEQLPEHLRAAIGNFFDVYKMLDPESEAQADGWQGADAARQVLQDARRPGRS
jgi:inorganic pyrophosphatase